MRSLHSYIMLGLVVAILLLSITGCTKFSKEQMVYFTEEKETMQLSTTIETADPLYNFDLDEYSPFLNKIWVLNDWDGGAYSENYSVFISKIEDGIIEGKLVIGRIAEPDFFEYSFSSNTDYLPIRGIINDNIAKCQFSNEDGKGNLNIKFLNNNQIEATIEYIHANKNSSNLLQNGTNLFIPYNLSFYTSFIINEDHTIKTNLKSWQNAILVSGEIEEDNGVYSAPSEPLARTN